MLLKQIASAGDCHVSRLTGVCCDLREPVCNSAVACAGNPVNALGQAIAQQQFNALVDVMTYEELYEYFGGASLTYPLYRLVFVLLVS